ncbi:hypothetical protein F5883DRAFT_698809, partial [Diaporthe sp. PMI_573]
MYQWQMLLRRSISGHGPYTQAWRSSQQNLNMSVDRNMCHPQVRFIKRDDDEDGSSRQSSPSEVASVHSDEEIRRISPLPDNIIFQILKELLTFKGLIHCFSRLDPHCSPTEFPSEQELRRSSTGIKGRFFITSEQRSYLSLTYDTQSPNVVLAALAVSRRFCWYGIHVFYASNSFAFSSLGEMDRFATGIGAARWQRIQNVELAWIGAKCVRFNPDKKERLNQRTLPLSWFCEAASLKTLCIHIRETHKSVIRRRCEPEAQRVYMTGKSSGQPNYRMTRSMRSTLGMDYVYQLRGMEWIRIYCLDRENINPDRSLAKIRDQSFVIDLERQCTQEKVPSRQEKSLLQNLDPLFPNSNVGWNPDLGSCDRVRPLFHEDTGYDNREND